MSSTYLVNPGVLVLPVDYDKVEPGSIRMVYNPQDGKLLLTIPGVCNKLKVSGVQRIEISDAKQPSQLEREQRPFADGNGFPLRLLRRA